MNWKQRTPPPNAQRPPHLTAEQMEAMLRPSPFRKQAGKHLEGCRDCRDEVENLSAVLDRFRASSVLYAEREQVRCEKTAGARGRPSLSAAMHWRWSMAGGVLVCVLAVVPWMHFGAGSRTRLQHPAHPVVPAGTAEISDDALLQGVQQDLATSVPAPLQRLAATSFRSSGSGASAGDTAGSQQGSAATTSH